MLTDDYCLTVNRMPVVLAGRPHGSVVTLRDRTELSGLLRELDSVKGLTDALRAQQHEFANRMHTVAGLLELGETEEALRFLIDLRGARSASPRRCARAWPARWSSACPGEVGGRSRARHRAGAERGPGSATSRRSRRP